MQTPDPVIPSPLVGLSGEALILIGLSGEALIPKPRTAEDLYAEAQRIAQEKKKVTKVKLY